MQKIVIIGAGNMGGAMIKGFLRKTNGALTITAKTQQTLDTFLGKYPTITVDLDNAHAVKGADMVILAVKPWFIEPVIAEILPNLNDACLVSVAANVRHERIDVYAMPNIAAEIGESMTFIEDNSKTDSIEKAVAFFETLGKVHVVPERQMGAGMMMAGCGIAYVMRYIRAMMEGGVEMGLYPRQAQEIAMQTMRGAVELLSHTGDHPEAAIDKVTTPGGVTIKGLNELDHAGFNSAVIRSLKAGLK